MAFENLFFWNHKSPTDNEWRPRPGYSSVRYLDNLPAALKRTDFQATVVDVAPFITGVGGMAHISQIHSFGFTAHASVFRNVKTMTAMHRAVLFLTPFVLVCQAAGMEYRDLIPRWTHDRERRRDEEEVRQHIDVGMALGAASWFARMAFKIGARYWSPIDVVMGGALADLMHREYNKAHGL